MSEKYLKLQPFQRLIYYFLNVENINTNEFPFSVFHGTGKSSSKSEHSLELFWNITLYMHYNAVQNTLFVECSATGRKNELNNWKSSVKLKHSYYIESKRSNMPETEIETIRIYVLVFLSAIRSNIRQRERERVRKKENFSIWKSGIARANLR